MTDQSVYWNPQSNYNGFHIVQSGQVQLRTAFKNWFLIGRPICFSLVSLKIKSWKCKSCNYEHFQISTDNSITATLNYKDKESIDYNELLGIYHHNGIITSKCKPGSNKVILGSYEIKYGLFRSKWDGTPPKMKLKQLIFSGFGVKYKRSFSNWMRCS